MHHGDDLAEHRTREASFGAQCTNHSANSIMTQCYSIYYDVTQMHDVVQANDEKDKNTFESFFTCGTNCVLADD